ncbi:MAG TPA: YbaK/EbsC family protein [Galbitalea sp.]
MSAVGVERFLAAVEALGLNPEIRNFKESTHTAAEAAAVIGCPLEAIVKSLVFEAGGAPLLVLVSGPNRVNTDALGIWLDAMVYKADADMVKAATGYSIGGVPPLGLLAPMRTLIDETLLAFPLVWAAAGSATTVFSIEPVELVRLTGATPLPI